MKNIYLTTNTRAITDPNFSNFLLRIGNDEKSTIQDNLILLAQHMVVQQSGHSKLEECLIRKIFSSL